MELRFTKAAAREIARSNKQELIRQKIAQLTDEPATLKANIIRLQNREDFRLRVQDWRIIFRIENDIVLIKNVLPRGAAYEERS